MIELRAVSQPSHLRQLAIAKEGRGVANAERAEGSARQRHVSGARLLKELIEHLPSREFNGSRAANMQ